MHHFHELSLENLNMWEIRVKLKNIKSLFTSTFDHDINKFLIIF